MSIEEYIKLINDLRKKKKNQWITKRIPNVEGKIINIKFFNTWIQRLVISDCKIKHSGLMDCKVSEFNTFLHKTLIESIL
jgi:hypothetical protein